MQDELNQTAGSPNESDPAWPVAPYPAERPSAQATAGLFATHQTDPIRETERILTAIAACPDRAIFIRLLPERARAEAAASARRHAEGNPLGPLDGIVVAWKDLFDLEGVVTSAGSLVLDEGPAACDAALVARLKQAGMVAVGRVNMTEFAFSGIGLNPHFGTPVNPWSRDEPRVPGGSSSGSAVAVARGLVPIAIGTDTGGSVRIPAAFNNLVGYKTSGGRWPMAGVFPLSPSLDTLGVFAHSVADAILVDAAARGAACTPMPATALSDLTIPVPTNVVFDDADSAVLACIEAALARFEAAGARLLRRPMPVFDEIRALSQRHGALVNVEAYALHRQRLDSPAAARMDARVVNRMRLGARIGPDDEAAIRQARARMIAASAAELAGPCVVAFPTVVHGAPSIAALEADVEAFIAANLLTLRNTLLGNFLDWCGVSLPCGFDAKGMPVGLLLSAGPGRDDHLLSVALAAESLLGAAAMPAPAPAPAV